MINWLISPSENNVPFCEKGEVGFYYEGYVVPRDNESVEFSDSTDLLFKMFDHYALHFIDHVKGNFIIILKFKDVIRVYSDRFGVLKYFYYNDGSSYLVSNSIMEITKRIKVRLSVQNMTVYALTYHFTGGLTALDDVFHNKPAVFLEIKDGRLSVHSYWNPLSLLNQSRTDVSIKDISESLTRSVKATLPYNSGVSLSLTGGADTRNLLSVMLYLDAKPHLYTYGNPKSDDCWAASNIANGLNLDHKIYDIKMSSRRFEEGARFIVKADSDLGSIHRVHRIMAVEEESHFANKMYLGTLGGEFIKGVSEDNYIVPPVIYENWTTEKLALDRLQHLFEDKCVNLANVDVDSYLKYLNSEPYMNGSATERKFQSLVYVTAHLHDSQDVNLYRTAMEEVYTPYLDVDYLELIFQSQYTFNNKEVIHNKYLKRIDNPLYCSRFLDVTYKPLTKFLYAGLHKPSEVLFNKYYAAITKAVRKKTYPKRPANFPLSGWMEDFVSNNLPKCRDYREISSAFKIDKLIGEFKAEKHIFKESYWLKYTNPIMMMFIKEELL